MSLLEKEIIRVEPTNPVFTVNWNIGLRCNFDCMYCPDMFHNLTDTDMTLAEFQTNWQNIISKTADQKLKYKITFTGGEVTVNKDFLSFVNWLADEYSEQISELGFTTNGSANKQLYLDAININIVSFISFSTHSEFFNEKKFFETVVAVHERGCELNKSIHVNVMDEYWNTARTKLYCEFLKRKDISHTLNRIIYTHKIRDEAKVNPSKQEFDFNG